MPTIETKDEKLAFVNVNPKVAFKTGEFSKMPWFTGVVADEGLFIVARKLLR